MKTLVFTFGRANPPTVGHEKLFNKVISEQKKRKADQKIYLSQTQDKKKNPLSYKEKVEFIRASIPSLQKVVQYDTSIKTIVDVLKSHNGKYDNIVLVVGSDRVQAFEKLLNDYNGKEYSYDSIVAVSAGERDPDQDGVEGMSASKMREFVKSGDFDGFQSGLSTKNKQLQKKIFDAVRSGMALKESEQEDFMDVLNKFIDEMDDFTKHIPKQDKEDLENSFFEYKKELKEADFSGIPFFDRQIMRRSYKRSLIEQYIPEAKDLQSLVAAKMELHGVELSEQTFDRLEEEINKQLTTKFWSVK